MDPKSRYIPGQKYLVPQKGEMRFVGFDDQGLLVFTVDSGSGTYTYDPSQEIASYKLSPPKQSGPIESLDESPNFRSISEPRTPPSSTPNAHPLG